MRALCLACLVLAAVGCAPSEEEIKADFKRFVDEHQACTQKSDCTIISPGCPLGCATPIASSAAAAGERVARDLIEDYESLGRSCEYECIAICGATCEAQKCVIAQPADDGSCAP